MASHTALIPRSRKRLLLMSRLVIALMVGTISTKGRKWAIFWYLLALGKECGKHDCTRGLQMLATEVGFRHRTLNGDGLAIAKVAADGELL